MLEKIPSESIMTDLLGKPLYDVWLSLLKTGHMSINTAEVEKLYVRYMLGTTVWDL